MPRSIDGKKKSSHGRGIGLQWRFRTPPPSYRLFSSGRIKSAKSLTGIPLASKRCDCIDVTARVTKEFCVAVGSRTSPFADALGRSLSKSDRHREQNAGAIADIRWRGWDRAYATRKRDRFLIERRFSG